MDEKTLALLEFDEIRRRVADRALSAEAAELLRNDIPRSDPALAAELKNCSASLCAIMEQSIAGGREETLAELPSVGFLFPRLETSGYVLSEDEAYALGLFARRGEELRTWVLAGLDGDDPVHGSLEALVHSIPGCSGPAEEVFRVLDKDGKVRDLPEIKRIRGCIQELSRELEAISGRYAGNDDTRRMLQSNIPSQRDGRLVLPVKANFRGRIKGIVHEVSATGQTIFVEPEESVELNNRILLENGNLAAEIRRVLRELTAKLSEYRETLISFHNGIVTLETIRARARYSRETRGYFAESGAASVVVLKGARHPLLGRNAVPIDLALGEPSLTGVRPAGGGSTRMVIITGPNTGGKTVALKTLGLFALMNQSGLALPANPGTALPFFDGVYADIGDEQSLSQSLSTFSGHMTNIAGIVERAGKSSLVLLDELGSGTDPEEGSAIAMAILDHFIETKSLVVVTTHHGMLKNYGYTREGVENASVEFDGKTLSPTYRIIMGIPGESRAVDIASRNGLPPSLVDKAREYLDGERADISALIAGLKEKHRDLDETVRKHDNEERRLREERRETDLKELRIKQKELELKVQGAAELRRLLSESRKNLENLVREIREGEMNREKTLRVKEFIRDLEADSAAIDEALKAEENALAGAAGKAAWAESAAGKMGKQAPALIALIPGLEVLAGPSRRRGRLIRRDNKASQDASWTVEVGSLKMSFPEKELVPAPDGVSGSGGASASWAADLAPAAAKLEISLRGMRLEEALENLRAQIDTAILGGLKEFSIVHGKGEGILQKGVHDFLAHDAAVEDYYFSRPELGGFGRTEVVLKG